MGLDRPSIEKRDFPVRRRGYDPGSVADHLARLADEVDALRRSAGHRSPADSLATAASEPVRLIVEAAERGAVGLRREAEVDAEQIRADARQAAEQVRADAQLRVREHLERVARSTASMLERADALQEELERTLELVRTGSARLRRELQGFETAVEEPPPAAPGTGEEDGARLIALNMALNGTPREETGRYLSDHFETVDADRLLDDVYVRAGQ